MATNSNNLYSPMADEYERKLESLQKYIPFLNHMIEQLKDPTKSNPEPRLAKMESLYSMITDRQKKLKLETLNKCEDVILKLYEKVNNKPPQLRDFDYPNLTPASPSPPRNYQPTVPVVIPTEKVEKPGSILDVGRMVRKVDIYSSAAESLATNSVKKDHFDIPLLKTDMSKPPISLDDLKTLEEDVNEHLKSPDDTLQEKTLDELRDLQKKLALELEKNVEELRINTTVRNVPQLKKQPSSTPDKSKSKDGSPDKKHKDKSRDKSRDGHRKSRDKSHDRTRDKDRSRHRSKDRSRHRSKDRSRDKSKDNDKSRDKEKSDKQKSHIPKAPPPPKIINDSDSIFGSMLSSIDNQLLEEKKKKVEKRSSGHKDDKPKSKETQKTDQVVKDIAKEVMREIKEAKPPEEPKEPPSKPEQPVFKRLADKYNPKPRKHNPEGDLEKVVSDTIEKDMILSPPVEEPPKPVPTPNMPNFMTPATHTLINDVVNQLKLQNSRPVTPQFNFQSPVTSQMPPPALQPPMPAVIRSPMPPQPIRPPMPAQIRAPMPPPPPIRSPMPPPPIRSPMPPQMTIPPPIIPLQPQMPPMPGIQSPMPPLPSRIQSPMPPNQHPRQNFFPPMSPRDDPRLMMSPMEDHFRIKEEQNYDDYGGYPPRENHHFGVLPPRENQYGAPPPRDDHYGCPTPREDFYDGPPLRKDHFGGPPPRDGHYGGPSRDFRDVHPPLREDHFGPSSLLEDRHFAQRHRNFGPALNFEPPPPPNDRLNFQPPEHLGYQPFQEQNQFHNRPWGQPPHNPPHQPPHHPPHQPPHHPPHHQPNFNRDPRNYREYKEMQQQNRDPRLNRDPRQNRDATATNDRNNPPRGRSESRGDYRRDRSRSRSRSRSRPRDSFVSPLDSLYNSDKNKVGKGYGVQTFRRRSSKEEEEAERSRRSRKLSKEKEVEDKTRRTSKEELEGDSSKLMEDVDMVISSEEEEMYKEAENKKVDDIKPKPKDNSKEVVEKEKKISEVKQIPEIITKDAKETEVVEIEKAVETEPIPEPTPEPVPDPTPKSIVDEVIEPEPEITGTQKVTDNEQPKINDSKVEDPTETKNEQSPDSSTVSKAEQNILAQFFANLMDSENKIEKKGALISLISTFSNSFSNSQLKRITQIIKQESTDEEAAAEEAEEEEEEIKETVKVERKKPGPKPKPHVRMRMRTRGRAKKKSKHKTELDMLHEDIQDMFIRDGVLTANGKRMCRMLKSDSEALSMSDTEKNKSPKKTDEAKADDLKRMSDVKVILKKMPENAADRSSRRSRSTSANYSETATPSPQSTIDNDSVMGDQSDASDSVSNASVTKVRAKRKRKLWASGFIKKLKKKKAVPSDSATDLDTTFETATDSTVDTTVEELDNTSVKETVTCEYCSYNRKLMAQHYKMHHPGKEIFTSRFPKDVAKMAIAEAVAGDYGPEGCEELSSGKYHYSCRFCDFDKPVTSRYFLEHITAHTGEFQYNCSECNYVFSTMNSLCKHLHNVHSNGQKIVKLHEPPGALLFGYMCSLCYYVQLDKKVVEQHVKNHKVKSAKVHKVNLSSTRLENNTVLRKRKFVAEAEVEKELVSPAKKTRSKAKVAEETTMDATPQRSKRAAKDKATEKMKAQLVEPVIIEKRVEKKEDKPEEEKSTQDKQPQSEEDESSVRDESSPVLDVLNVLESPKPELEAEKSINEGSSIEEDNSEPPVLEREVPKEIDMNVFTCDTDINADNDQLNLDRLKMMEDVNKAVGSRHTLNFVSKLSSRLMSTQETVKVKEEPVLSPEPEAPIDSNMEIETPIMPTLDKVMPKKPKFDEEVPQTVEPVKEVPQKNSFMFDGMIDKLKRKLEITPPKPDITKTQDISDDDDDGPPPLVHINEIDIKSLPVSTTIFNNCNVKIIKQEDIIRYSCHIRPCIFTTESEEAFMTHCKEHHPIISTSNCDACGNQVLPTMEDMFHHILEEHLTEIRPKPPPSPPVPQPIILKMRRLSGDMLSKPLSPPPGPKTPEKPKTPEEPAVSMAELELADNPFPFKISGVMSLADSVPPLSPINLNPVKKATNPAPTSVLVLKEVPMTPDEIKKDKKSQAAQLKFLHHLTDLYKCPKYDCQFSTPFRQFFDPHAASHQDNSLIPCVYCHMKVPLDQMGTHVDIRHSHCRYSCTYCLYRAIAKEYVMLHQEMEHKGLNISIKMMPQIKLDKIYVANPEIVVRKLCVPYSCKPCNLEFLFENEFRIHAMSHKQPHCTDCSLTFESEIDLVTHWNKVHNVRVLQCAYCNVNYSLEKNIFKHLSLQHPNLDPHVLYRKSVYKGDMKYYTERAIKSLHHITSFPKSLNFSILPPIDLSNIALSATLPAEDVTSKTPTVVFKQSPVKQNLISKLASPGISMLTKKTGDTTPLTPKPTEFLDVLNVSPAVQQESESDPLAIEEETIVPDKPAEVLTVQSKKEGLKGEELFKCAFCINTFNTLTTFRIHVNRSQSCKSFINTAKPYECAHCGKFTKTAQSLVDHIQFHGTLRYHCSLCDEKFPSVVQVKNHMKVRHSVTHTVTTLLNPDRLAAEEEEFIIKPKFAINPVLAKDITPLVKEPPPNDSLIFMPDQINSIPMTCIFNIPLKCALCNYTNKVRTNFIRHMKLHLEEKAVPESAPVNPVPCLDKEEKMFDKMTNLAYNGFQGTKKDKSKGGDGYNIPDFVATHSRYACCAENCNYLCPEEGNLKHHMMALHVDETKFSCPHCKLRMDNLDVEVLLKHYRLHGLLLYGCGFCKFVHHLKHKVEKHLADNHADQPARIVTIRNMEAEPQEVEEIATAQPPKQSKPWRCSLCKSRWYTLEEIENHVLNKHEIDCRYKCALCTFKSNIKEDITVHFTEKHIGQEIDIISVYYKVEKDKVNEEGNSFDTTPLWQRDRPRVRHIRGILFEDAPASGSQNKSPKKVSKPSTPKTPVASTSKTLSNLDLSIEAVVSATTEDPVKETTEDVIILIDDEDDHNNMTVSLLKEEPNDCIEIIDIEENDGVSSPEMLIKKFGQLGSNFEKCFECPICRKYRSHSGVDFIYHMFQEKNIKRYTCKLCKVSAVTWDFMVNHMVIHPGFDVKENIADCIRNIQFESWIQLLMQHQAKSIVSQFTVPKVQYGVPESKKTFACDYCSHRFSNTEMFYQHQFLHWSEKPFLCMLDLCGFAADRLVEMQEHYHEKHSGKELVVKVRGPVVSELISPKDSQTVTSHPRVGVLPQEVPTVKSEDVVIICELCAFYANSLNVIEEHVKSVHVSNLRPYRRILRKAYANNTKTYVACAYCTLVNSDLVVREHHMNQHPNQVYKPYRYTCTLCPQTYLDSKNFKSHFAKVHPKCDVRFKTLDNTVREQNKEPCRLFKCLLCSYQSLSNKTANIRMHLRTHTKPVSCGVCNTRFPFNAQAKQHFKKKHPNAVEMLLEDSSLLKETNDMLNKIVVQSEIAEEKQEKKVAKKSTSKPPQPPMEEFSYYGNQPEKVDLKKIMTTVEVHNIGMNITAEQLSNIFNLYPEVEVEKCDEMPDPEELS